MKNIYHAQAIAPFFVMNALSEFEDTCCYALF